jgi:hypothetical protein
MNRHENDDQQGHRRAILHRCRAAIVTMTIGLVVGCGSSHLNWTEDVLLPDGRTVSLKRHQDFERHYSWEALGNGNYWLEFKNPDTGELIRWNHDRGLGTVALIMHSAAPYLLTMTADGFGAEANNNPNPPYLLFKYDTGKWRQLTLKDMPVLRLRSNMTFTGYDARQRTDSNGDHLTTDVTQVAVIGTEKPWVMDFSQLKEQTFGYANRDKKLNDLVVNPGTHGDAR